MDYTGEDILTLLESGSIREARIKLRAIANGMRALGIMHAVNDRPAMGDLCRTLAHRIDGGNESKR